MPYADTEAMQMHIDEISRRVARGSHAVLLLDRAGWHTTDKLNIPENMTLIFLPSRAPELNPVENIWQYLRANWLSNRVFETYDEIIEAACDAWKKLTARQRSSPQSACAIGRISVIHKGRWYYPSSRVATPGRCLPDATVEFGNWRAARPMKTSGGRCERRQRAARFRTGIRHDRTKS